MPQSKSRKARRRRRASKQDGFKRLRAQLKEGPFHDHKFVIAPGGEVKMSEVLGAFIEPYIDLADTIEAYRRLLTVAVAAWNIALAPKAEQQKMLDEIAAAGIPADDVESHTVFREMVTMLIARKKQYFAAYTRNIIAFEVTDIGDSYHLVVASTLENDPI